MPYKTLENLPMKSERKKYSISINVPKNAIKSQKSTKNAKHPIVI